MSEVVSEGGAGGGRLALETLGRLVGSSSSRGLSLEGGRRTRNGNYFNATVGPAPELASFIPFQSVPDGGDGGDVNMKLGRDSRAS